MSTVAASFAKLLRRAVPAESPDSMTLWQQFAIPNSLLPDFAHTQPGCRNPIQQSPTLSPTREAHTDWTDEADGSEILCARTTFCSHLGLEKTDQSIVHQLDATAAKFKVCGCVTTAI